MRKIFFLFAIILSIGCKKEVTPTVLYTFKVVEEQSNLPIKGCKIKYWVSKGPLFSRFANDGILISQDSLGLTDSMGIFSDFIRINSEEDNKAGIFRYIIFDEPHTYNNFYKIKDGSLSPHEINVVLPKMSVLRIKANKISNCSKHASLQVSSWIWNDMHTANYIDWKIDFGYSVNKDTLNNIEYFDMDIIKGNNLDLRWKSIGDTSGVCIYTPISNDSLFTIENSDTTFINIDY